MRIFPKVLAVIAAALVAGQSLAATTPEVPVGHDPITLFPVSMRSFTQPWTLMCLFIAFTGCLFIGPVYGSKEPYDEGRREEAR